MTQLLGCVERHLDLISYFSNFFSIMYTIYNNEYIYIICKYLNQNQPKIKTTTKNNI